jgi:hypothetical protein
VSCGGGTTLCGGKCVDTKVDAANCGACGAACGAGKACLASTCQTLALYTFSGIQQNLPIAQLTGWTQCYLDSYGNSGTTIAAIQAACSQSKLLMGCRTSGASTLLLAANAPRTDVFFDTGTGNTPHNANNVGWYYSASYSWGFAPMGSPLNRNSCDIVDSQSFPGGLASDGAFRLCWHTGGSAIDAGWRCGKPDFLGNGYERLVYQAP